MIQKSQIFLFDNMIQNSESACQMIFLIKYILLCAIEWRRFCWKIVMCQSKLLSYECFTLKTFLLGRTQCQEFDCLYRAKRYCHPCSSFQIFVGLLVLIKEKRVQNILEVLADAFCNSILGLMLLSVMIWECMFFSALYTCTYCYLCRI